MDLNNLINKIGIKQKEENKALDTYIENYNQNNEKLETLLSKFKEIVSDGAAPRLYIDEDVNEYYNYINKKINDLEFDRENLNLLLDNLPLYQINIIKNNDENTKFGLFLSALINKNLKAGEKVQITALMPINFLFYRLENVETYVNKAGDYLGYKAKNSKICAGEARDYTGYKMEGCELHVKKAKDYLGESAKNSRIYADESGNQSGKFMEECELRVKKSDEYLGNGAKNSRIYADEAENRAGWVMEGCELYVKKANDSLGYGAENSRIYADEAGDEAGPFMQNSKLFIYELNGKLAESCLKRKNKVYLGKESYDKFPEYHRKVKIWEKKALDNALKAVPADIQDRSRLE